MLRSVPRGVEKGAGILLICTSWSLFATKLPGTGGLGEKWKKLSHLWPNTLYSDFELVFIPCHGINIPVSYVSASTIAFLQQLAAHLLQFYAIAVKINRIWFV
ncbi:hypothetical protein Enr8_37560 [Blastopirellula retiformator]|uniref:Uncharacterized protein n=1 Tax=Blastopirellula retiformator TaxID=2527970 RepID=A0A5C5V0D0_9BACT|nr:hypothetical protein Enr8_37560 [Blastopirellula retiformator]